MRILVTNDDGISAPGLEVAEEIARRARRPRRRGLGRRARLRAVRRRALRSPTSARCGSSGSEPRRFAVEGSPADCVLAGLHEILKDGPPDLVISGVNRGHNVAEDTLYSGTVGGAMEAALHGVPRRRAVAVPRPGQRRRPIPSPPRARTAPALLRRLLDGRRLAERALRRLLQRQLPAGARRRGPRHPRHLPGPPRRAPPSACCRTSRRTAAPSSGSPTATATPTRRPDSDSRECHDGYITVTPLIADLTAHDLVAPLAQALG